MALEISNYYELLALHKMVMEAKFHRDPDDHDIADSPIAARVACMVVDALKHAENARGFADKAEGWERWKQVDPNSRFWKNSVIFARHHEAWDGMSAAEKRELVGVLLAPFEMSDDAYARFVREVASVE